MLWDETDKIHSATELKDSNGILKSEWVWNYYLVIPVCVAKQCVARPTGTLLRILKIPCITPLVFAPSSMTEFYAEVKAMMQLGLG